MKQWGLFLSVAISASPAFAQSEQWLTYHTSTEGRAYHQMDVTTKAPPDVALPPKLNGEAYFARWVTPMDPGGGRWICFERSRKYGPCDRLFIDSNGNGRLDDEKPVQASLDSYSATFPAAAVVFKGGDGPITYHLAFRFYQAERGKPQVLAMSAGWYEGMINFGGVKKRLRLVDGNVNGTFNDHAADPYASDRVQVDGDKTYQRFLGRLLEVDGKFYRIEVARDGAFLKIQKEPNVTLSKVSVPADISSFAAFGDNGHFVRKPVKGELTLPVGQYRMVDWAINRKDDKGANWTLSGDQFPETANFEVVADKNEAVKIGEPVRAVITATNPSSRQLVFSLEFKGQQNETIRFTRDNQRPRGPKLTLTDADGKLCHSTSFEFG